MAKNFGIIKGEPKVSEKPLPVNKGEKLLPVDETPDFDISRDRNNEEFVNANDPEKKFIPINEVPDEDSDFIEQEREEDDEEEAPEPADDEEKLEEVRNDIANYTYTGPDNVALASFHVDHDKEEMIAVTEEGLTSFRPTDPETIEDAPSEEELAKRSIAHDRKMSTAQSQVPEFGGYEKGRGVDNLKTMPEAKIQRANRGLIRKFLDTFSKN